MTIHHDKMAYGKLASTREDVSEERLNEMLLLLSEEEDGEGVKDAEVESCPNKKKIEKKN